MHIDKNCIEVVGTIVSDIEDAYEYKGIKMKRFYVESKRLTGTSDTLLVIVKERNLPDSIKKGTRVSIAGEIRCYANKFDFVKTKTVYAVFAKDITKTSAETDSNFVTLIGYPVLVREERRTLSGCILREVVVAVNSYFNLKNGKEMNKSQYINCIARNRAVSFFEAVEPTTPVEIKGRFQSRNYTKPNSSDVYTVYEVAISAVCEASEEVVEREETEVTKED